MLTMVLSKPERRNNMGIGPHWSFCSHDWKMFSKKTSQGYPNPDPKNFFIEKTEVFDRFVIIQVVYPDCTNFEGKKILVYEDVSANDIHRLGYLDPHFCDDKHISPIARFIPTDKGWRYAKTFCRHASRKSKKGGGRDGL